MFIGSFWKTILTAESSKEFGRLWKEISFLVLLQHKKIDKEYTDESQGRDAFFFLHLGGVGLHVYDFQPTIPTVQSNFPFCFNGGFSNTNYVYTNTAGKRYDLSLQVFFNFWIDNCLSHYCQCHNKTMNSAYTHYSQY